MSIEGKHAYRFGYMNSEEWKNVRTEALARFDARCCICGRRDFANDAHHVFYENSFWDTKADDLVILCRDCHNLIHEILKMRESIKDKSHSFRQFRAFIDAISNWHAMIHKSNSPISNSEKPIYQTNDSDGFKEIKKRTKRLVPTLDMAIKTIARSEETAKRCLACKRHGMVEMKCIPGMEDKPNGYHPWCNPCWNEFLKSDARKWPDIRRWMEKRKVEVMLQKPYKPNPFMNE